jgi:hypothetical protein
MTLKQAAALFFGDARHAATLRVEIDRGNLVASKIGRAYWTTLPALTRDGSKMPRRSSGPRLYWDRSRESWTIIDGRFHRRTGFGATDIKPAERALRDYIESKHKPAEGPNPLLADILAAYAEEHIKHVVSGKHILYDIGHLNRWWGTKKVRTFLPLLADSTLQPGCRGLGKAGTSFLECGYTALEGEPRPDDADAKDQAAAKAGAAAGLHDPERSRPVSVERTTTVHTWHASS